MAFEKDILSMMKTLVGDFSMYMSGDSVYFEGIKKVLSVSDEKISLQLKKEMSVYGKTLEIDDCGKGYFSLSGKIEKIERS